MRSPRVAFLFFAAFFTACAAPPAEPMPDGGAPMYVPNSVGAAIGFVAQSACDREARCGMAPTDCVSAAVASYCDANDCTAAYHDWTRLKQCVTNYDALPCVTTFPPQPCSL